MIECAMFCIYLPRLFVYHCEAEIGSKQSETFKVMERRLMRAIINPAMILLALKSRDKAATCRAVPPSPG